MKRAMKIAAFALVLVLGSSMRNNLSAQYRDDVSYQTFYDELSPYGQWVDYPEYGYVWVPDAGPDFQPYSTNGHWVWTDDYEWMWVSDYDWGWAPFHYGRWFEDDYYGWVWVPGYEWSPAWVAWRDGGEYYGWAPLRPGISVSINFNIGSYNPPYNYWCFVPRRHITSVNLFSFCLERRRNVTIINQTVIINNYNYSRNIWRTGPRRYDAEIYCGRITPSRFRDSYSPGRTFYRNNEVNVYRPNIRRDDNRQFAPRRFQRFERNGDNRNGGTFRRNSVDNRNGNQGNSNRNDRRVFDRRNDEVRTQGDNQGNRPGRRFERPQRTEGGNDQPARTNERRVFRPDRNPNQGNSDNPQRTFERRNNNNGNGNGPVRQPRVRNEEKPERQQPRRTEQPRQFERRNDAGSRPQQQRVEQRRTEQPRQQQQRVEQRRSEQPRQFERRSEGGNRQQGSNGNRGRRSGRD